MPTLEPARFFIYTALGFGLLFVFLTPPFQSPDEYNHFFRAWQVSEGHWAPEKIGGNRLGGELPVALDSLKARFLPLKGHPEARTEPAALRSALDLRCANANRCFIDFPNTAIYAPTAYIPQAIGIGLARQFTDRVLLLLYAARLTNLLFWAGLVWAALRYMPFQRWTLTALALLPASLAIAASCSADVLTNGLAFYLTAVFCRQATNRWAAAKTMGPVLLVAFNKLVFVPLALLAGLSETRGPVRAFGRSMYLLLPALLLALWWARLANDWFVPYDRYDPAVRDLQTLNPGVDPAAQIHFIVTHPFRFAQTVLTSAVQALPSTAAHVVGKFGWEKNYLPAWLMALLWAALAALLFSENNPLRAAQRLWLAGIALICLALWAVTMYALWCPVGAAELDNWQGRYFVPLFPLITLAIGEGWGKKHLHGLTLAAAAVLLLGNAGLAMALIGRYWA